MSVFKKNRADGDGIEIISATRPGECGGTDASIDRNAPKKIISNEITCFSAESVISAVYVDKAEKHGRSVRIESERIGYVKAFAVPAGEGSFIYLEKASHTMRREPRAKSMGFVKENVFPALAELVRECDLAKQNGYHSTTHGLPENFGGSVLITYSSGEKISFEDNQTPVLRSEAALAIYKFFEKAVNGEKTPLPDADGIKAIRFEKKSSDSYMRSLLTVNADGSAVNEKESKYGDSVYTGKKEISADTVAKIKQTAAECLMLGWDMLPAARIKYGDAHTLTFVLSDGKEITVANDRELPYEMSRGFFNIELELSVKG